jgi:hypothetical protein
MLPPGLEPEQEGLAASTPVHDHGHSRYHCPGPSHDRIGQYNDDDDDDRNTQRTSEEPTPYSLPKPLDEDGGGGGEENLSELERDMLLAFEEQENTNVEDVEDDEEPRPAKRRKLPSAPTHQALSPPLDYNSKARLEQPYSIAPHLATQLEVDDTHSQADPENPPTPVDDEQHNISRTSRSPSAPTESVKIAKYHEWPF